MYFPRTKDSVPENSNQDIVPRAPELTLAPSGGLGLYLSRRLWSLYPAPPTPIPPPQACTAENKNSVPENSRRASPQGHGNSLSPFLGVGGGFFPDGNR
ncbi:hypothetical protein CDAR_205591 [Caerostris darwini]|uniref:Uncharacterized protein n=1 Tax=Caerostris darwini TaxID=1538125 RepID=A0AAV4WV24_9ARAC|nr:hypothetical protein CDAR_205591 [Caerostris darwini]